MLYGDQAVVATVTSAAAYDTLDVCGTSKQVCLTGEIGKTYAALQASGGSTYAAFFCATPDKEPSCVPSRPAAVNGSTICTRRDLRDRQHGDAATGSAMDNCPHVFSPSSRWDSNKQPTSTKAWPRRLRPLSARRPADRLHGTCWIPGDRRISRRGDFTDVGQMGTPTFPSPLTLTLNLAPSADTFVAVASSDPAGLTVVGGGVPWSPRRPARRCW